MTTPLDKMEVLRLSTDSLRAFREGQMAALAECAPKSFFHVPENLLAPRFNMPEEIFIPAMRRGYAESLPYYRDGILTRDGMVTLVWAEAVTRSARSKGVPADDPTYLALRVTTEEIEFYALRALRAEAEVCALRLRLAALETPPATEPSAP